MIGRRLLLGALFLSTAALPVPGFVAEAPLFQFVQISDSHIGLDPNKEATLNQIVDSINAMPTLPAFVIVTGDLTENGLAAEYTTFKSIMARLNPAVARHYMPGNHETMSGTWANYQAQIGPLYESFTYANCLFLLTNGSRDDAPNYHENGFIDSTQLQWIQTQLQGAGGKTHVVLADHYPLGTQWGLYSIIDPAMSTLQGWMKDYKVTAWLNGHRHFDAFYADTARQTSHIACGITTGYFGFAGPGYRLNSVYSDRIVSKRVKMYAGTDPNFVEPAADYVCPNPRAVATPPAPTLPRPDHVVLVIEENKSYSEIIGNPSAPYINSLANLGASFTSSYAVTHPSQPNYLALFSGSTQGVTDDVVPAAGSPYTTANLGAELVAKGFTFGGYSETMPSVGFTGGSAGTASSGTYQRKHNPWVNWQGTGPNQLSPSVNMPYAGYFPSDFSHLPTVSIVIPNQLDDMHDGSVAQGDAWLQANFDSYIQWAKTHNSLFILTFDEDDFTPANQITTIFVGPMVKTGQYSDVVNHYTLLRTLEDLYGLSHAGAAAAATPITGSWQAVSPTSSPTPSPSGGNGSGGGCGLLGMEILLLEGLRRLRRRS
ncbi:MAG TPA: alkaline phosphatase family protein [Planctomycetota bacterium]|nr:alkaline phosphatase family protein [Planctomycetota bacterium]